MHCFERSHSDVSHFMNDIEKFALNHKANRSTEDITDAQIQPNIAGESGRLAFVLN
jgi:hypothetical protein